MVKVLKTKPNQTKPKPSTAIITEKGEELEENLAGIWASSGFLYKSTPNHKPGFGSRQPRTMISTAMADLLHLVIESTLKCSIKYKHFGFFKKVLPF